MDAINKLAKKLSGFIELENKKTHEEIAAYIVGELIGDYDGIYAGLSSTNKDVERIADLASDLEWSNGSPKELEVMWTELKGLVTKL